MNILVDIAGLMCGILFWTRHKRKKDAKQFARDNNSNNCCKRNEECRLTFYKWRL